MSKHVMLALGFLVLSACQILPDRPDVTLYQLPPSAIASGEAADGMLGSSLRLDRPGTSDALGGNRILVLSTGNRFEAYPGARWSASVPTLWRDWLLDAFWREGSIEQLSVSADGLQAQFELGGMLRALHTEFRDGRTQALVRYDALLVDTRSREIVASQRFEAREPTADNTAESAVAALGVAADRLASELIDWALVQIQTQDSR